MTAIEKLIAEVKALNARVRDIEENAARRAEVRIVSQRNAEIARLVEQIRPLQQALRRAVNMVTELSALLKDDDPRYQAAVDFVAEVYAHTHHPEVDPDVIIFRGNKIKGEKT